MQSEYNPNHLLDHLMKLLSCRTDAALAKRLQIAAPVVSKIRHRRLPVGASLLIRMHEESGLQILELRDLMGDRRTKFRMGDGVREPKLKEAA